MGNDEAILIGETCRRIAGLGDGVGLEAILKGGSGRRYFRVLVGGEASGVVLMAYTDARPDNLKYVGATRRLEGLGVSVPRILAEDAGRRLVWLEDIGREDLFGKREAAWEVRRGLYFSALDEVARIHGVEEGGMVPGEAEGLEPGFDEGMYLWEQGYCFEHFVGRCTEGGSEEARELAAGEGFLELARELAGLPRALVHRDFQSENVLVREGGVCLIDFQGLRLGLPEYDVASLVYDPYVRLRRGEREELVEYYGSLMGAGRRAGYRERLAKCALQRLMQALGAYGNLGLNMGKRQYLGHIAPALENVAEATAGSAVEGIGERIAQLGGRLVEFGGVEGVG